MKILVVTEYVRREAWDESRLALDLAHALVARGHGVTLACDGIDDARDGAALDLRVRDPERHHLRGDAFAFRAWAARLRTDPAFNATLSLTRLCAGDCWAPLEPGSFEHLRSAFRRRRLPAAGMEFIDRPNFLLVELAQRLEARAARARNITRRVLGPAQPGNDAAPALGMGSTLPAPGVRPGAPDADATRARVRALLGLPEDAPVVLLNASVAPRAHLEPPLLALARLRAMRTAGAVRAAMVGRGLPPATVALSRRGYTVQQAAQRAALSARLPGTEAALGAGVWFLTETARPDALLAACDLAVAPAETEPGAGRFVADALRCGVPVVAHRRAPGAGLLAQGAGARSAGAGPSASGSRGNSAARAGLFVDSDTPEAWLRALTTALDERWLGEARAHAARAADSLAIDALAARIEALLVHPRPAAPGAAGQRSTSPATAQAPRR